MVIIQASKFYFLKGGAERYMLELSDWLESQGHEVVPFAMQHPENMQTAYAQYFPSFVQTERAKIRPGSLRTFVRLFYSIEARRNMAHLIEDADPDICHIHNIYSQISPSILDALKERGIPVVMTVHDQHLISPQYNVWVESFGKDYSKVGIIRGTLSRFHKHSYLASFAQVASYKFQRARRVYEKNVDLFLPPSQYLKDRMIAGGFPKEKIRVVPHGIDPDIVEPRFDSDGYVLFVGRLSEEKGAETVIRIAGMLPDISFKIVGRGPEEARLHALGHAHDNIEFLGFKVGDELKDLYRGAKAVLLPSRVHENFPLTALESMAAGTPVIASNVGGIPEVVEDRVSGFLVPPADLHAWVEAVMRIAYDDRLATQLAREARLAIETTFHVNRNREGVLRAYEEVTRQQAK